MTYYSLFLLLFSGIAALLPFLSIYMKQLGLSAPEVAIIYGIMPFVSVVIRPLVGALADYLRRTKLVLVLLCILNALTFLCFLLVPYNTIRDFKTSEHLNRSTENDIVFATCKRINHNIVISRCSLYSGDLNNNNTFNPTVNAAKISAVCQCRSEDDQCSPRKNSTHTSPKFELQVLNVDYHLHNGSICSDDYIRNMLTKLPNNGCDAKHVMDCEIEWTLAPYKDNHNASYNLTFWLLLLIYFSGNTFFVPIFSLSDAVAYDMLGPNVHIWGLQRVWGSVGFGLVGLLSTVIREFFVDKGSSTDYSVSFYIYTALVLCAAALATKMKVSDDLMISNKIMKEVLKVLMNLETFVLFAITSFSGFLVGALESFLFWYLIDLGSTQILLGLCLAINCVSEIFMFSISGRILTKIGVVGCTYAMLLAFCIRFVGYSLLTNPWYALPLELLNGVTFSLFWAAVSSYTKIISPPGTSGTMQGLVNSIYHGVGEYEYPHV